MSSDSNCKKPGAKDYHEEATGNENSAPEASVVRNPRIYPGPWSTLAVFICAFLVFAGTLGHELVWDDTYFIGYSTEVAEKGGFRALASAEFKSDMTKESATGYYRPIILMSFWIDDMLGASSPFAFHMTNVLLHALCSVLVLVLLRMLLASDAGAIGGALLFALHPIHVESVAFVSGRSDLFAALFCLVSTVYWLKHRRGLSSRPFRDQILSLAAFILACFSKEVALVLPAILISWDYLLPGEKSSGRAISWRSNTWLLNFAAIIVGIILLRYFILDIGFGREAVADQSGLGFPDKALATFLVYIRLLILPVGQMPNYWSHDYSSSWVGILLLVLLAGLSFSILLRRTPRMGLAGVVWIIVFLVPVSGIVQINGAPLAERFLYLPSVGLCLIVGAAWGMWYDNGRKRIIPVIAGLTLLLLCSAGSYFYSRIWKDDVTLYSEMILKAPESVIGYFNLGNTYRNLGRVEGAEWAYRKAIVLEPRIAGSRINLMSLYLHTGKCKEAADVYRATFQAFSGKPDDLLLLVPVLGQFGLNEAAAVTIRQIRSIDEKTADRALSALSSKTIIDTTCSRSGWPPQ